MPPCQDWGKRPRSDHLQARGSPARSADNARSTRSRRDPYTSPGEAGWTGRRRPLDTNASRPEPRNCDVNSVDGISVIIPAPGLFRQLSQMDVFSGQFCNSQSHAWRNNQGAVKSPGRGRWAPQRRQYVGAKWLMQRCLVARIAPLLSAALTRWRDDSAELAALRSALFSPLHMRQKVLRSTHLPAGEQTEPSDEDESYCQ